jgi:hypothetical protein
MQGYFEKETDKEPRGGPSAVVVLYSTYVYQFGKRGSGPHLPSQLTCTKFGCKEQHSTAALVQGYQALWRAGEIKRPKDDQEREVG